MEQSRGLPSLYAKGENISEAWENSVVELYNKGLWYNRMGRKDKERRQIDSTMTITINNPQSPLVCSSLISRSDPESLFEYQMEILGAKDSWVDKTGKSTKWPYHYHERLASYPGQTGLIDQIQSSIDTLIKKPATRQAMNITWVPGRDSQIDDPPCLQGIWFGLTPNEDYNNLTLNMNYNFRSRNVMIAALMNQFGLATLQAYVADKLSEATNKSVIPGRIVDHNFSYHVSSDNVPLLESFVQGLESFKERGWGAEDRCLPGEIFFPMLEDSKEKVVQKIINQTEKNLNGSDLEKEIQKIQLIADQVSDINKRHFMK